MTIELRCVCDDSCCGEWGKRAYLMERSVFGLPEPPTRRYRLCVYSMIYLPVDRQSRARLLARRRDRSCCRCEEGRLGQAALLPFPECRSRRRLYRINCVTLCRGAHGRNWPIATGDILTARRRFRGIADMDRFSSRNDLKRMTLPGLAAKKD